MNTKGNLDPFLPVRIITSFETNSQRVIGLGALVARPANGPPHTFHLQFNSQHDLLPIDRGAETTSEQKDANSDGLTCSGGAIHIELPRQGDDQRRERHRSRAVFWRACASDPSSRWAQDLARCRRDRYACRGFDGLSTQVQNRTKQ